MWPSIPYILAAFLCAIVTYAAARWGSKKLGNVVIALLLSLPWIWVLVSLWPELTSSEKQKREWGEFAIIIAFLAYSGYAALCLIGFMFGRIANKRLT